MVSLLLHVPQRGLHRSSCTCTVVLRENCRGCLGKWGECDMHAELGQKRHNSRAGSFDLKRRRTETGPAGCAVIVCSTHRHPNCMSLLGKAGPENPHCSAICTYIAGCRLHALEVRTMRRDKDGRTLMGG